MPRPLTRNQVEQFTVRLWVKGREILIQSQLSLRICMYVFRKNSSSITNSWKNDQVLRKNAKFDFTQIPQERHVECTISLMY